MLSTGKNESPESSPGISLKQRWPKALASNSKQTQEHYAASMLVNAFFFLLSLHSPFSLTASVWLSKEEKETYANTPTHPSSLTCCQLLTWLVIYLPCRIIIFLPSSTIWLQSLNPARIIQNPFLSPWDRKLQGNVDNFLDMGAAFLTSK